eukprot:TRINITY_DN3757_c0_g1_i1.p1 TRINITY_DN3757_c0_g1~~TRINITY_DN3757_c0_g1_i1.p1  ORF type:complete len:112 (+),score=20.13 TRINITY_DN3757_c0_g1_i1:87-422(+)
MAERGVTVTLMSESGDVCLKINGIGGTLGCMVVNIAMTILQVKAKVRDEFGVPFAEQRLLFGNAELSDSSLLASVMDVQSQPALTELTLVRCAPATPTQEGWLDRDAWCWG